MSMRTICWLTCMFFTLTWLIKGRADVATTWLAASVVILSQPDRWKP